MRYVVRSSINVEPSDIVSDLICGLQGVDVAGSMLFLAPDLDYEEVCKGLGGLIPFVGCTSLGNMSKKRGSNHRDETALLVVFVGKPLMDLGPLDKIGIVGRKYMAFSSNDDNLGSLMEKYACLGGLAADDWTFDETAVFYNGKVLKSGTVGIDVTDLDTQTDLVSGWEPIPTCKIGVVTKAVGKVVYTIDDIAAVEYYNLSVPSPSLFGAHPALIASRGVMRASLGYDLEEGSVTFSDDIKVGESIVVTSATRNHIYESTRELIALNEQKIKQKDFILAFSCGARNKILADLAHKEFEFLREVNPNTVLVWLYGEFHPIKGKTSLENQHIVIGMF